MVVGAGGGTHRAFTLFFTGPDGPGKGHSPGRFISFVAIAALLVSAGHVVYAIWRDHLNGGEGLLAFFR